MLRTYSYLSACARTGFTSSGAAWPAVRLRGNSRNAQIPVVLSEMRPGQPTPAHRTDRLAELVCSNTFKSTELTNAHGLLKAEMRVLGSLVLAAADAVRVPGGTALAVDREAFAAFMTERVSTHPQIHVERTEVTSLPSPGIVATGPLTSDALAVALQQRLGAQSLAFYDAIAPVVDVESIDHERVFRASRYGKETMNCGTRDQGSGVGEPRRPTADDGSTTPELDGAAPGEQEQGEGGAYINCPFTREEYDAFIDALSTADQHHGHEFDAVAVLRRMFTRRGNGAAGPRCAAVRSAQAGGTRRSQRPDADRTPWRSCGARTVAGRMWNLVGFQTRLRIREQQRVFRLIPGLAAAEFLRYGSIHRNSYVNTPAVLSAIPVAARRSAYLAGRPDDRGRGVHRERGDRAARGDQSRARARGRRGRSCRHQPRCWARCIGTSARPIRDISSR